MKLLILSCNTGEGHNAAGRAVEEAALAAGHSCDFLDLLSLVGENCSRRVSKGYVAIVNRTPHVFQALYGAGDLISSKNRKSPVYWINRLNRLRLLRVIREGGYDAVVMPHLFPAETVTALRREGQLKDLPLVAVATDYVCIPFWEETECDRYIIPHRDLAAEFEKKGIPPEKLLPWGIPVKQAFSQPVSQQEARARLDLPQEGPVALLMSGSMGYGKLPQLADALLREGNGTLTLCVICGNNEQQRIRLERRYAGKSQVRILGYTQNVADYMAACDVVLSKPGGLSSTEAAVAGAPLVHTAPIPGCETYNAAFFAQKEMALGGKTPRELARSARLLWESDQARELMRRHQREHMNGQCARQIVQLLESLVQAGEEKRD